MSPEKAKDLKKSVSKILKLLDETKGIVSQVPADQSRIQTSLGFITISVIELNYQIYDVLTQVEQQENIKKYWVYDKV